MNCITVGNILDYFVDDRLAEPTAQKVKSHLGQCLSCSKEVSSLHQLKKELRQLEGPILLANLRNAIYSRTFSRDLAFPQRFNWKLSPAYRFAFAYLALMITASFFSVGLPSQLLANEIERPWLGEKNG